VGDNDVRGLEDSEISEDTKTSSNFSHHYHGLA